MKERKKAIINILLLFLTLVINALGALGLINGLYCIILLNMLIEKLSLSGRNNFVIVFIKSKN